MKLARISPLLLLFMTACGPGDRVIFVTGTVPENKNCVLDVFIKSSGHQRTQVSGDFEVGYSTGLWFGERFSNIEVLCEDKVIYKEEDLSFSDIDIGNRKF